MFGVDDIDGPTVLINARSQDEVLPRSQRCIDLGQRARRRSDKERADGQRGAGSPLPTPPPDQLVPEEFVLKAGENTQ